MTDSSTRSAPSGAQAVNQEITEADLALLGAVSAERVTWRRHAGSYSYGHRVDGRWTTCTPEIKRLRSFGFVRFIDSFRGEHGVVVLTPEGRLAVNVGTSSPTVGSLFAGVGGFDVGFGRAGMTTSWTAEVDARCRALLEARFPEAHHYDDVRKVDGRAERVDVVCGGFPCQDVSVAGRRAGLAGERSGLWFEFRRVLDELRPSWCVIENVPGLLSSNGGRDMGTVLGGLADLGYGFAYRVLDAQWLGLAQRRKRLFVVGCLGDAAGAVEVLLEPEGGGRDHPPSRETGTVVAALTANGVGTCGADDNQGQAGHLIPVGFDHKAGGDRTSSGAFSYDLSPTLQRNRDGMAVAYRKVRRAQTSEDDETWDVADVANTLNAFDVGDTRTTHAILDDIAVRRLTPLECERLQGFPDDWTAGQPDSARYKQMGNAVAVNVSEWIGRRIITASAARQVAA